MPQYRAPATSPGRKPCTFSVPCPARRPNEGSHRSQHAKAGEKSKKTICVQFYGLVVHKQLCRLTMTLRQKCTLYTGPWVTASNLRTPCARAEVISNISHQNKRSQTYGQLYITQNPGQGHVVLFP